MTGHVTGMGMEAVVKKNPLPFSSINTQMDENMGEMTKGEPKEASDYSVVSHHMSCS